MSAWLGGTPEKCDTCESKIESKFYDAGTSYGLWAIMCSSCFHLGPGFGKLGKGFGQEYTKQDSGKFVKTGG